MVKKFGLPVFFFQVSFLSEIKMAYLVLIHAFFKILFYFILFAKHYRNYVNLGKVEKRSGQVKTYK